jgi:iron-sulfur cluster assembly protein
MITISETALKHLKEIMKEEGISNDTHFLRVGVKGGGCSGLSYVMDFDDIKTEHDELVEAGDDLKVLIDKKSLLYLIGTELQFSTGVNGKGFEWVNPNASRTCGCGESFSM